MLSIAHFMDPDEITHIVEKLKERRIKKIISNLEKEMQEKVEFLLRFNSNIAAGIMSLDYIIIDKHDSLKKIREQVETHLELSSRTPIILFFNESGSIKEVPLSVLFKQKIKNLQKETKDIATIKFDASSREVISTFRNHNNEKVVVLDEDNSIIGIIYANDVLKIIDKKATKDIYGFAGVKKEEDVLDLFTKKVKHRYSWLILNLFTVFMAAFVVGMFQESISKLVVLAIYLPIVAGMGGNAGTQTLAVVVRGLALREITSKNRWKILANEVTAGLLNGLITGVIVGLISFVINRSVMLGVVISISLVCNLIIAALFATIIPLTLKRIGVDPASASSIFITTATDIFGFFIFLQLATILLL